MAQIVIRLCLVRHMSNTVRLYTRNEMRFSLSTKDIQRTTQTYLKGNIRSCGSEPRQEERPC